MSVKNNFDDAHYYIRVRRDCLDQVKAMERLLSDLSKCKGIIVDLDNDTVKEE